EVALVAVDRLEHGARKAWARARAELAAVERGRGCRCHDTVGVVRAVAVHLGVRRIETPEVVPPRRGAAEPRLRERVLAVVAHALGRALPRLADAVLVRRRDATHIRGHGPHLAARLCGACR